MRCFCLVALVLAVGLAVARPAAAWTAPGDTEKIDVQELVHQAVINFNTREALPRNYTYVEILTDDDPRLSGGHGTDTYEVMEMRGQAFRRHVVHNGMKAGVEEDPKEDDAYRAKWLDVEHKILEEQIRPDHTPVTLTAAVQKIMEEAGLKDWKPQTLMPSPGASMGVVTFTQTLHQFKLPLEKLDQSFHLKVRRNELLDGRMAYVVQADPKHNRDESDPAGNFKITVWIDEKEKQIVKVEGKAVRAGPIAHADYAAYSSKVLSSKEIEERKQQLAESRLFYSEGTTILQEWTKVNDEAWLLRHRHVKGNHLLVEGDQRGFPRIHYSYPAEYDTVDTNYKKFRVEHRILPAGL
jgi:hypothetical protein